LRGRNVELLHRREETMLGRTLGGTPLNLTPGALDECVYLTGAVDPHDGVVGQIRGECVESRIEVWQEKFDAGKQQAICQTVDDLIALVGADVELEGAALNGTDGVAARAAMRVEFAHRQDEKFRTCLERALAHGVE